MEGCGLLVAAAAPCGRTWLPRTFATAPLSVWPVPARRWPQWPGIARVHLVGSAAGPLGEDETVIDVQVGERAALEVTSAEAALALGSPEPGGAGSRSLVRARVAAGGFLCWQPQPLILTAGAVHRSVVELAVEPGGAALWWETVVLGRADEPAGTLESRLRVDYGGQPLVRHDLRIGDRWPGWDGYGALGPARVQVTALWAGATALCPDGKSMVLADTAAMLCAEGPAVLVTASAASLASAEAQVLKGLAAAGAPLPAAGR